MATGVTLSISELFTPAPSGVDASNPAGTPDSGTWLYALYQIANTLGLPTTSWQPGDPSRTIFAVTAQVLAQQDSVISIMNQGGFLDFAADGTVTYTAADGTTTTSNVSPDPSVPSQNPNATATWLDVLSSSVYSVTRLAATAASGLLAIANINAGSVGPFAIGTYHVGNASTGATYSNRASVTIPSSQITGSGGVVTGVAGVGVVTVTTQGAHGLSAGQTVYIPGINGITLSGPAGNFFTVAGTNTLTTFTLASTTGSGAWTSGGTVYLCTSALFGADLLGPNGTATPGTVTVGITSNPGVSVANLLTWTGSAYESNAALAARDRLALMAASPNGPANAYDYFALTSQQLLAAETIPITLRCGAITSAITYANDATGLATIVIAGTNPASTTLGAGVVGGYSQLAITAATTATPIAITVASAHHMITGDYAIVSAVEGLSGANGTWQVIVTGTTTFTLTGSAGSGTWTSNTGSVECGDVGAVDSILQAYCTPSAQTSQVFPALAFPVALVATVFVPAALATAYTAAVALALQALAAAQPIGGKVPPAGGSNSFLYNDVIGTLEAAGIVNVQPTYVAQVSGVTINGSSGDLPFPSSSSQLLLPTPSVTVVGV